MRSIGISSTRYDRVAEPTRHNLEIFSARWTTIRLAACLNGIERSAVCSLLGVAVLSNCYLSLYQPPPAPTPFGDIIFGCGRLRYLPPGPNPTGTAWLARLLDRSLDADRRMKLERWGTLLHVPPKAWNDAAGPWERTSTFVWPQFVTSPSCRFRLPPLYHGQIRCTERRSIRQRAGRLAVVAAASGGTLAYVLSFSNPRAVTDRSRWNDAGR